MKRALNRVLFGARSVLGPATPVRAQEFERFANLRGSLFVVTYGRSGSTLVQSILQQIPGLRLTGENSNTYWLLYLAAREARRTRDDWGQVARAKDHPWFGADAVSPEAFEQAITAAFTDHLLAPPPECRWLGFKEIRYPYTEDELADLLDFMSRLFPNPYFVFVTRDAAEVAQSAWWADHEPEQVAQLVARTDARMREYAAKNAKRCFVVDYAEFSRNPQALAPVFEMIGEPFSEDYARACLAKRLTH